MYATLTDAPRHCVHGEYAASCMVPETLRTVKAGSPGGALGQKEQVVVARVIVKLGHARIICLPARLHRDKKRHDVGASRVGRGVPKSEIRPSPEGRGCLATALFPAVAGRVRGYFRRPLNLFCPTQSVPLHSPPAPSNPPPGGADIGLYVRAAVTAECSLPHSRHPVHSKNRPALQVQVFVPAT